MITVPTGTRRCDRTATAPAPKIAVAVPTGTRRCVPTGSSRCDPRALATAALVQQLQGVLAWCDEKQILFEDALATAEARFLQAVDPGGAPPRRPR